jgi:preprotein translocase subunit YajC
MVPMIDVLAQDTSGGSPFTFLIFLLPIAALFFMMRSQRKKLAQQQAVQQAVDVGDDVLLTSGIFGRVDGIDDDDDTIWVEVAPGTRIHAVRGAIARRVTDDVEADDEGDSADAGDEGATGAP